MRKQFYSSLSICFILSSVLTGCSNKERDLFFYKEENIIVTSYPFNGKKRIFNPDGSDYNYDNPLKENINIKNLTHQFIHSQILFPIKEGRGLHSIMVTSDKMIYTKIYEIDINDIIKIFKMVSNNYVGKTLTYYDKNKEKVIIICE